MELGCQNQDHDKWTAKQYDKLWKLILALQGRLVKVNFGFQKTEEVVKSYMEICTTIDLLKLKNGVHGSSSKN